MSTADPSALARALSKWRATLGESPVVTEAAALDASEKATFATYQRVGAIIFPASTDDVVACIRVANEERVPLYPISRGKNWGYGSRVPVADGSVILDLGRMNRIVDFSEELAYVVVEPGVTQKQLADYLRERGSRLCLSPTTGSPLGSVIGITLERGYGRTAAGDYAANTCAYEVVLGSGRIIRTGAAGITGARTRHVDRWGVGPSLDALFAQSSFGVVTQMTIWLKPFPEQTRVLYYPLKSDDDLRRTVDALRPLRIEGTLTNAQFSNEYRFLARITQYPWEQTKGATPLQPELALSMARNAGFDRWNVVLPIYGSKSEIESATARISRAMAGVETNEHVIDKPAPEATDLLARLYRLWSADLDGASALARAYWRKKTPPPKPEAMDLDKDGCGFIFMSVVSPLDGAATLEVNQIVRANVLAHGFEPDVNFVALRERTANFHCILSFDRGVPGEDGQAMLCYKNTMKALRAAGFPPLRLGVQSMDAVERDDDVSQLLTELKNIFDPNGIIAPGRYIVGVRS